MNETRDVSSKTPTSTRSRAVGIWIRVSTDMQVEAESPEHHERRARMYAESRGWRVACVYRLEAVSGKSVRETEQAKEMMADVRAGKVEALIFSKLARLARNTKELLEFAEFFRSMGSDLVSLDEAIDTSTPAGRFFYTLLAAMAEWEREEIAARVAASVPVRAKLGKPLGGAAPFGYRWNDRQLEVDPQHAPIRSLIYEWFAKHKRLKTVARMLNEAGYRTRGGAHFTDTTVKRLLQDPSAKGERRANYTRSTGQGKHWEIKDESDWVTIPCEPIVSVDLWNECNALLESRRRGHRPQRRRPNLFSGFVHCQCGSKMYVPSDSRKYTCYHCRNKVPIADLETVFAEQLKGYFLSPERIAEHLSQADEVLSQRRHLCESLETERARLKRESDKLYQLYQADHLTPEEFGERNDPLSQRRRQLEDEIPRLRGEIDYLKINCLSSAEILNKAHDLYGRWSDLTQEEKRTIVENLVEQIIVGDGDISINLCYIPPISQPTTTGQRNNADVGPDDVASVEEVLLVEVGIDEASEENIAVRQEHGGIGVLLLPLVTVLRPRLPV